MGETYIKTYHEQESERVLWMLTNGSYVPISARQPPILRSVRLMQAEIPSGSSKNRHV